MSNTYKVIAPSAMFTHDPGEVFEHDFSPSDEADLIANGRIEIVPREYRVVGSSTVNETEPGKTFTGTFTVGQERALLDGGHIERVESKPKAKAEKGTTKPEATNPDEKEEG